MTNNRTVVGYCFDLFTKGQQLAHVQAVLSLHDQFLFNYSEIRPEQVLAYNFFNINTKTVSKIFLPWYQQCLNF